jgi:hypothetical protein
VPTLSSQTRANSLSNPWSDEPIGGATEIIVNHFNIAPAELAPALNESVLTSFALKIVHNLMRED